MRNGETSNSARGTRWPAGSSVSRMVARKARRSRGRSRCRVAAHDQSLQAGFVAVHHKIGRVTWLNHKTKTGGLAGGDRIRARREASKRRTHVRIARLASRLSEVPSPGISPIVLRREFPKCPSGPCILILCNRASFVFRLSPNILR
jgi:hypothetical protein